MTWLKDLKTNGFCVVPGAIPLERAKEYNENAISMLESFPYGFNRNDIKTWTRNCLPDNWKHGIYNFYGISHENWVWNIRQEPGIIDAFAKVWETDELIVSFDGINISLPVGAHGRVDITPSTAWPHMDQAPTRPGFQLVQGIATISNSGPQDGGLVVLKKSHSLIEKFIKEVGIKLEQDKGKDINSYSFIQSDIDWMMKQNIGVEEIKVESKAGDLILWDSRTIHWNRSPVGDTTRVATYVCYAPASLSTEKGLKRKVEIFKSQKATTHWPQLNVVPEDNTGGPQRNGVSEPLSRIVQPVLSLRGRQLAGIDAY